MALPRVIVEQRGARRRYAVPRILEARGLLEAFYTDSHSGTALGRLAALVGNFTQRTDLQRLTARKISGISANRIRSSDRWLYCDWKLHGYRDRGVAAWLDKRDEWSFSLLRRYGLGNANILYSMNAANFRYLQYASQQGLKVVVDAFISPMCYRDTLVEKERLGLSTNWAEQGRAEFEAFFSKVFHAADIVLCPSQWVAEGVKELAVDLAPRIRVCPYGSSLPVIMEERKPVQRRIFWAGNDWFRKGLHHLAAAADILKRKNLKYDFRAAGITDPQVTSMPRFKNIHFLGKLDRQRMEGEFSTADLFVFPTLSEGMAGVVIEAIGAGCPVITTRSAGIDAIEHGVSGVITEANDSEGLASAIESLCSDRSRIETMGRATRVLAEQFTERAWGDRLTKTLEELVA